MNTNEINMTGQWFGQSASTNPKSNSLIVVNIEPRFPNTAALLGLEFQTQIRTIADAILELNGDKFVGKTFNYRIYDQTNRVIIPFATTYNSGPAKPELPQEAEYEAKFDGRKFEGTYKNNLGQTGNFQLWRSFSEATQGEPVAKLEAIVPTTWDEFKKQIARFQSKGKILFRGQHSNAYPLRTSFHRKERNNLLLYLSQEVERLRHQINAISHHYYHQTSEDLYGLLNLAQHHGFPTPFLDWTESPYVAAFFAFDCLTEKSKWSEKQDRNPVRIFAFDLEAWRNVNRMLAHSLHDPVPDFQFFHPPANNNPRYYPQQSMAAFSNIDKIEEFIAAFEQNEKKKFLTKFDIQASERKIVEDELRFMGITPATLFPGFEGACKSLRDELF